MTEDSVKAMVIDEQSAPRRDLQLERGISIDLVNDRTGSRQLDAHVNVLKVGGVVGPYHMHTNAENMYYILDGEVQVNIDGVTHDLTPGSVMWVPPGVPHSALNTGDVEARLLEIYTPPGADFVEVD